MTKTPSVKKMAKNYLNIKKQLLKNNKFILNIKIAFSIMFFILSIWIYGYFVNISSTKGYFLKQERQKLSEIKFQNDIVKIDIGKKEWEILDQTLPESLDTSVPTTWKVIVLSNISQLTVR